MIEKQLEMVANTVKSLYPDTPVYVRLPCAMCGKVHEELVVDRHIAVPHLCENCSLELIKKHLEGCK